VSASEPSGSGLAIAACCLGLASIGFGVAGMTLALGFTSVGLLVACLAIGWRSSLASGAPRRRSILLGLAAVYLVQAGVIGAIVLLDDPEGAPRMWLGLPAPTALLVYALWPLGVMPALLFAARFRDTVLPEDRLRRFLDAHGRRD
jgi:hypothetical protein